MNTKAYALQYLYATTGHSKLTDSHCLLRVEAFKEYRYPGKKNKKKVSNDFFQI
jgi:hypothetical protein